MNELPTEMRIGPTKLHWNGEEPKGNCSNCGGQCGDECGIHPMGCIYGGFTEQTSYWLIVDGCSLYHGE